MSRFKPLYAASLCALVLAGCSSMSSQPGDATRPSILFVHDNGESAAAWQTQLWRFESNGWPASRLHTLDLPYPYARDDDTRPQAGRSSSADFLAHLKAEITAIQARNGNERVILIGAGRGANAIRNYVQNGGLGNVSHAILAAPPSRGVWAVKGLREQSEFSGLSNFIRQLNARKDKAGNEVPAGVRWMTLRSDNNDKFAQPTGEWIGNPLLKTNITYKSPELKGAENVVLKGADHRETAYSAQAFEAIYHFITREEPKTRDIVREDTAELDGVISGIDSQAGGVASNLPLKNARIEVYPVDPATGIRTGRAVHTQTVDESGRWGDFEAETDQTYEFVISARGYPTHHFYRSPFPRSSKVVNFRLERLVHADPDARAIVVMSRPRGYFDVRRDTMSFGRNVPPPGIPPQGAGVSTSRIKSTSNTPETVVARFNNERIAGRTWPLSENRVVYLELTD